MGTHHRHPPQPPHPGHAGLGDGVGSQRPGGGGGLSGTLGFASSPLGWHGSVSPRRGDNTRRSPPKRPPPPPPRRGCRRVRGAANTPRRCIIYKPEEQRVRQQLQSPRGPPCPASRSHRARWHAGTAAPAAGRDNGDEAARGAGRATGRPDATPASLWTGRAAAAARGDIQGRPVSPAPARHPCHRWVGVMAAKGCPPPTSPTRPHRRSPTRHGAPLRLSHSIAPQEQDAAPAVSPIAAFPSLRQTGFP